MNEEEILANNNQPTDSLKKKKGFLRETLEILIFVIPTVLVIQTFIGRTFIVIGNSMYPTFHHGDYLIIDKLSYRLDDPKRFDVIVFHPPAPADKKTYYIKRIIGLPGETVKIENNQLTIINTENPEGFKIDENYRSSESDLDRDITLKTGEYFVMGDNRSVSSDSRSWGALPRENISGRALVRLFPIGDIDLFPGKKIEN